MPVSDVRRSWRGVAGSAALAALVLAGCGSGSPSGASAERCSVFLIESPPGGEAIASTSQEDIRVVLGLRDGSLEAEGTPSAAAWDLVVAGRPGVMPAEGCRAGLDEFGIFDVLVYGSEPNDGWWGVLVETDDDLDDLSSVALNGRLLDLAQ